MLFVGERVPAPHTKGQYRSRLPVRQQGMVRGPQHLGQLALEPEPGMAVATLADQACGALARIDPDDPGVPWAIGSEDGGHISVHPELGTLADFDALVAAAAPRTAPAILWCGCPKRSW